jgi:CRISPR-associated protein Csb2
MLALSARLRFGTYDAASADDPRQHEWPPHPARVFCALVASDPSDEEWAALEWLERQPPPIVLAPDLLGSRADELFVPTNDIRARNPNLPGRVNGLRRKPRSTPRREEFHMVWTEAPSDEVLAKLDGLAARVGYVGRSTSSVALRFGRTEPAAEGLERYVPSERPTFDLRVPFPGLSALLRDAHESGRRAWEVTRVTNGYARAVTEVDATEAPVAIDGPFDRVLVWNFTSPVSWHASATVTVAESFRAAVMSLMEDPLPSEVSGHGADGRHHVAFLALPNVGAPGELPGGPALARQMNVHADGRLLGIALAVPQTPERLALDLYRALVVENPGWKLRVPGRGGDAKALDLTYVAPGSGIWGTSHRRWVRPSSTWATATPLVLDRFPKGRPIEELVVETLVTAGYPAPVDVGTSRSPLLPGAPSMARSRVQRRAGLPSKPSVHAWVRFERPVAGPVLAGSMRYRGLGLFAPLAEARADEMPEEAADAAFDEPLVAEGVTS